MPESRRRDDIWLNAYGARPNFDLNTWKTILHFVHVDRRRLFGETDLFFDSSGDRATKHAQEKTMEPIPDRFIYLHGFDPNIPR